MAALSVTIHKNGYDAKVLVWSKTKKSDYTGCDFVVLSKEPTLNQSDWLETNKILSIVESQFTKDAANDLFVTMYDRNGEEYNEGKIDEIAKESGLPHNVVDSIACGTQESILEYVNVDIIYSLTPSYYWSTVLETAMMQAAVLNG